MVAWALRVEWIREASMEGEFRFFWRHLHIAIGRPPLWEDAKSTYEDDVDSGRPSKFYQSWTNWAFSSTGHFMGPIKISLQFFDNIKIPVAHCEFSVDFVNLNFLPCGEHFPNGAA